MHASVATMPFAPVRFSRTTCCPRRADSSGEIARMATSMIEPGADSVMKRTGLAGNPCAAATPLVEKRPTATYRRVLLPWNIEPPYQPGDVLAVLLQERRKRFGTGR